MTIEGHRAMTASHDTTAIQTTTSSARTESNAPAPGRSEEVGGDPQRSGNADAAIADLKVVRLDPRNAFALYDRFLVYDRKHDLIREIADLDAAIQLKPDFAIALNKRGRAIKAKGDLDRAMTDFSKAIASDPKLAIAYANRGVAYKNKGDLARASLDLAQAFALDPSLAARPYSSAAKQTADGVSHWGLKTIDWMKPSVHPIRQFSLWGLNR